MILKNHGAKSIRANFSSSDRVHANPDSVSITHSRHDMDEHIAQTSSVFFDTFERVHKSGVARLLDSEFGDFDMPKIAKKLQMDLTPSNIVLGTDAPIIKFSELVKYEEILAMARTKSRSLRALEDRMAHVNREMWNHFLTRKILYRGMKMSEFSIIARMGGAVGFHRRIKYAAVNDFVSCSTDAGVAALHARGKKRDGLIIEMDVSQMKNSECAPVTYDARRHVRVTRGGRRVYNPYEMFGGRYAGGFIHNREIHLRNGSKPIITGVEVLGERPPTVCRRLYAAAKRLESVQRRKIIIKYVEGQE